jgi:hypothetical protein
MQAYEFLYNLRRSKEHVFQIIPEGDNTEGKYPKVIVGSFKDNRQELWGLNQHGSGVHLQLNYGKGRKLEDITGVSCLFADFDDPDQPLPSFPHPPTMIVSSSPGKYHCYWKVAGIPLDSWKYLQKAIAERFNSDRHCYQVNKTLRLPGFYNRKYDPAPKVKVILHTPTPPLKGVGEACEAILGGSELVNRIKSEEMTKQRFYSHRKPMDGTYNGKKIESVAEGDRSSTLFRIALAMRKRGESYDVIENELLFIAGNCSPAFPAKEAMSIVKSVWRKY